MTTILGCTFTPQCGKSIDFEKKQLKQLGKGPSAITDPVQKIVSEFFGYTGKDQFTVKIGKKLSLKVNGEKVGKIRWNESKRQWELTKADGQTESLAGRGVSKVVEQALKKIHGVSGREVEKEAEDKATVKGEKSRHVTVQNHITCDQGGMDPAVLKIFQEQQKQFMEMQRKQFKLQTAFMNKQLEALNLAITKLGEIKDTQQEESEKAVSSIGGMLKEVVQENRKMAKTAARINQEMQEALATKESEIEKLRDIAKGSVRKTTMARDENADLRSLVTELEKQNDEQKVKMEELLEANQALKSITKNQREKIKKLQGEKERHTQAIGHAIQTNSHLKQQNQTLEEQLLSQQTLAANAIQQLTNELATAQAQATQAQHDLLRSLEISDEKGQLQKQRAQEVAILANNQRKLLETELQNIRNELQELHMELDARTTTLGRRKFEIIGLQEERVALEKQALEANEEINRLKRQNLILQQTINSLRRT